MKITGMSKKCRLWTPEEDAFLKKYFSSSGIGFLQNKLNRTELAITARANKFKLRKKDAFRWDAKNTALLKELYAKYTVSEIAKILGISKSSAASRIQLIGLKKSCSSEAKFRPGKNRWLNILGAINE